MQTRTVFPGALLLLALAIPSACSGGGGAAAPATTPPKTPEVPKPLDPESLAAMTRELSAEQRTHMIQRTSFGSKPEDREELASLGLARYVEKITLFSFNNTDRLALSQIADPGHPRDYELAKYWQYMLLNSPNTLQEVLGLFWHDHFAAGYRALDYETRHLYLDHIKLVRWRTNTNLRKLLSAYLEDATVQIWLDGIENHKGKINENLAREFWELLSLGVGAGYTAQDIIESARSLTGYRLIPAKSQEPAHVVFDPSLHDDGMKTIFGITGNFTPHDIVDLTLENRKVAEYICGRLFSLFCYPDPPPQVVDELAKTLRNEDYELRPVLRQILNSEAFFSAQSREKRVKSPIEFAVGFARTTGILPSPEALNLQAMGHVPGDPPNVGGWPEGRAWLKSQAVFDRANAITHITTSYTAAASRRFMQLMPSHDQSPKAIVEALVDALAIEISESEHDRYSEYLDTRVDVDIQGKLVYSQDLFDPASPRDVDERFIGLLYILSQHPSYYLR